MTNDKLAVLIRTAAQLLDRSLAVPANVDREKAALDLADGLIGAAVVVLPDAVEPLPQELHIAGFTIGYCDDGSAYLEADNRPGEEGVSVRMDHLSAVLSALYMVAKDAEPKPLDITVHIGGVEIKPCGSIEGTAPKLKIDAPWVAFTGSALDALDIPETDQAARVIDGEKSFDNDADCEGCKI